MKLFRLVMFICLLSLAMPSWSMRPPQYLSVPKWQHCVSEIKPAGNTASFICLPKHKPVACPYSSWKTLIKFHEIKSCGNMG